MACTLYIDDYRRISTWENCIRVALESAGDISITYNDGSDIESYNYSKGYVYYNGSEIKEGWEWRDDSITSEIAITISDKIETPSNPDNPDNPDNPSNPSTATIRYYFKNSGDPADYSTGYVGDESYKNIISHYGLSLVAGQTYVKTLTYYTDSNQSETNTYDIISPKDGYLLYSVDSLPELGQEDYNKVDYDIKVYCFKAPTITVTYTSTPDTIFGTPPATISVLPDAGKVGSFTADWGMIGGMTVTTTVSNIKSGYIFKQWNIKIGDTTIVNYGSGVNKEYTYTVDTLSDVTITANFERLPAVKLQVNPSGAGTTDPTAGTLTSTGTNYQIALNATPNYGYKFKEWSKNGTNLSNSASYTYKASEGENSTITANFELKTYTISTIAEPENGGTVTGGDTYNHGDTCTLTATPELGYIFKEWIGGNNVTTNPLTFNVTKDSTYTAKFAEAGRQNVLFEKYVDDTRYNTDYWNHTPEYSHIEFSKSNDSILVKLYNELTRTYLDDYSYEILGSYSGKELTYISCGGNDVLSDLSKNNNIKQYYTIYTEDNEKDDIIKIYYGEIESDLESFNFTINCTTNNSGNANNSLGLGSDSIKEIGSCWWVKFIEDSNNKNKIICRYFSADYNSDYISSDDPDIVNGNILTETIEISPSEDLLWTLNYAKLEGTNEAIKYNEEYNSKNLPKIDNKPKLGLKVDYTKVYYRVSTVAVTDGVESEVGGTVTDGGTFEWTLDNSGCTCTATPKDGYEFDIAKGWQLNSETISTSESFNFKPKKSDLYVNGVLTNNILFRLVANFEKIYIPSDPKPESPTIPEGYENKMITNKEIQKLSLYSFNLNNQNPNKCPTFEHITNTNYNYSIVGVKDGSYSNKQCVKYSDIVICGVKTNIAIKNETGIVIDTPRIYLGTKNSSNIYYSQLDDAYVNKDIGVGAERTYQININCLDWSSNSEENKLVIKVDGHGLWGGDGRKIYVNINGVEYGKTSGTEEVFIKEIETMYLGNFLRNNYKILIIIEAK